jgi:hypothetical protein
MPFPVKYSKEYDRVRERLSPGERTLVGVFEDEIAENPDPGLAGRREHHGYCYDTGSGELMIEYRLLESGWVSFDRLIDLRNPTL